MFVPAPAPEESIFVPKKGFKPIGTSTNSLRRFFPGDEDDMELSSSPSVATGLPEKPAGLPPRPESLVPQPAYTLPEKPEPVWRSPKYDQLGIWPSRTPPHPYPVVRDGVTEKPAYSEPVWQPRTPELRPLARSPTLKLRTPSTPSPDTPVPMEVDPPSPSPPSQAAQPGEGVYSFVNQVGEGTFGKVYKVLNTQTGVHVALKRIRMEAEKDGFPVTAMREIKLLQSLNHENVVRLFEMLVASGEVSLILQFFF